MDERKVPEIDKRKEIEGWTEKKDGDNVVGKKR